MFLIHIAGSLCGQWQWNKSPDLVQEWWRVCYECVQTGSAVIQSRQQRCNRHWEYEWMRGALWMRLWCTACSQGLVDSIPLSQKGLTCTFPLARPMQPKLVRGAGPKDDVQSQSRVCHEQLQDRRTDTHLFSQIIHVGDVVHLDGVSLGCHIPARENG